MVANWSICKILAPSPSGNFCIMYYTLVFFFGAGQQSRKFRKTNFFAFFSYFYRILHFTHCMLSQEIERNNVSPRGGDVKDEKRENVCFRERGGRG
jgi:hypothetical protein